MLASMHPTDGVSFVLGHNYYTPEIGQWPYYEYMYVIPIMWSLKLIKEPQFYSHYTTLIGVPY